MQLTDGFDGLSCLDCGNQFSVDTTTGRCPDCGGALEAIYDEGILGEVHESRFAEQSPSPGLSDFEGVLPFDAGAIPTLAEGATPTVDCPTLADGVGAASVCVKDEARNTTGAVTDREMALAVAAADQQGATEVALPTTGNAGQSAAAYAARAGIESTTFAPSRSNFANKAMINVHGGEMNVVGGRYGDAVEAFADASEDESWHSLAPFATPFRHEGAKTIAYELVTDLGAAPDAVVHPTAHGTVLFGMFRGFRELASTGTINDVPRLYAAQPEGCAPIVTAHKEGTDPSPVEQPDTISGALEVPDPAGGKYVLDAIDETEGDAVAVSDKTLLEESVSLAQAGVPTSATGGAAVGAVKALGEQGEFEGENVVLINPTTSNREADILRSHLMSKGI